MSASGMRLKVFLVALMVGAFGFLWTQGNIARANVETTVIRPNFSESGFDVRRLSDERRDELAAFLTEEQRRIILKKGTEAAFCGTLLDNKKEGFYSCALCGLPLFASDSKFESGSGWPSFFQPYDKDHIAYYEDNTMGMRRVEITCMRCDGHLGHVFPDGPKPTGLRYCLNSESLDFVENGQEVPERSRPMKVETAYFAGGCFWGIEDQFQHTEGVIDAASGYQGGDEKTADYKTVCSGDTTHAESVRVVYDPQKVSYRDLLKKFFEIHNPTTLNRQGPDIGTQYRSAIFAADEAQQEQARAYIKELTESGAFDGKDIVTEVKPFEPFYEAEQYHQDFNVRHGRSCGVG